MKHSATAKTRGADLAAKTGELAQRQNCAAFKALQASLQRGVSVCLGIEHDAV